MLSGNTIGRACAVVLATCLLGGGGIGAADGKIAYLQFHAPFWQVAVMNADGSAPEIVTELPGDKLRVSWFPDGRRILYNLNSGRAYIVDLETREEKRVPIQLEGMTDAVVSPDGEWIVFSVSTGNSVDNNDLWRVRPDGSDLSRLAARDGLQHYPTWSADGQHLFYLYGRGQNNHDLFRIDLGTRDETQLTVNRLYNFDPAISKDRKIALSSNRSGDYEIWVLDWNGKEIGTVAPAEGLDSQPAWSPDGKWLAFTSSRDGGLGIWKARHDGQKLERLTPTDKRCKGAEWAP